jgi:hypothetical protein
MSNTIDRGPAQMMQKFVLTPEEKRVIAFILTAFVLGLAAKHYRNTHPHPVTLPSKKTYRSQAYEPSPSPTSAASIFESLVPAGTPARKRARKPRSATPQPTVGMQETQTEAMPP